MPSRSEKIKHAVVHWSVRFGAAAIVVLIILAHLHIIEGEYSLLPLTALILLLSEQINELTERSSKSSERVKEQVELLQKRTNEQTQEITALTDSFSFSLLGLNECVIDLSQALSSIPTGSPILIEHFALNMTQAWLYFERLLRTHPNLSDAEYRLLILTDDVSKIEHADDEVKSWARDVPWSLDRIKKDITGIFAAQDQQYRSLKFEVRKYASVPIVHGFRIAKPDLRCYMAICRWGGQDYQRYEWGEPQYQGLAGGSSSPAVQDMLKIFDGYFNHHWQIAEKAFYFEHPRQGGQKPTQT